MPPSPSPSPQPFGKYLLDAELAEGGMARVFRARLRGPGGFEKRLVVKQILPKLAMDPGFIELFVREANTLVQMSHPNVVPVYELGVVDGVYFLAMELVEGATVAELLRDGPLPEALVAHIGVQVCEALRYAHERFDLVHRDVTPRNVIADGDGHVRLLDFGIAAPLAGTGTGELFGSPGYMAPEQRRGEELGAHSDLFSLGSVLYEALRAERALARPDAAPAHLEASADVSGDLAELINALLALDPAARPRSAADVAARLRTWLAQKHPEGVARALGKRVEQARARIERAERGQSERPPPITATDPLRTPQVTRSIATSKSLDALLAPTTEALPRAALQPTARPASTPAVAAAPRARRMWPALIALSVIGLSGGLFALAPRSGAPAPVEPAKVAARVTGSEPAKAAAAAPPPAPAPPMVAAPATREETKPEKVEPAPAARAARLTVNALPWAELRLDGRPIGVTPKRGLSVPPGAHVLQLDCPPLGRSARIPLKLAPGAHDQVLVDLNVDPPRRVQ